MEGTKITLQEMMDCREQRVKQQKELLEKYSLPMLSFCMNIPGPVKTTEDIRKAFELGKKEIFSVLEEKGIPLYEKIEVHKTTGDELLLVFDASASEVKTWMMNIEEKHPLGRLFDIDILDEEGKKISRHGFCKCLICNCQAQECARTRRHTVEEMQKKIQELMK